MLLFWNSGCRMEIYLPESAATEKLGNLLGRLAWDGCVFCLSGSLGAGKTLMSRGVAVALGAAPEDVSSPTFALMNIYQGRKLEIRHFDFYRLNRPEELEDIGFSEYVGSGGVNLIEWAELFPAYLPEAYLAINLSYEGAGRRAVLTAHGQAYEELLKEVERCADFSD